jgi:hypothetical protein
MLLKISPEANEELLKKLTGEEIIQLKDVNKSFALQNLILIISLLQVSQNKTNQSDIPQLPLEMALIEYSLKISPSESELKKTSQITSHQNRISKNYLKKNSQKQTKLEISQPKNSSSVLTSKITKKFGTSGEKSSFEANANTPEIADDTKQLLDIKIFLDNWADILTEMGAKNQSVLAFLKNCAPVMMSGPNVLIKTKYSFHKDKLNETKNRLTIEKVFVKILEVPLKVKFVTEDELPDDNKISESSIDVPQENNKVGQNLPDKETVTENSSSNKTDDDLLYEAMKKVGGKIIKK